MTFLKKSYVVVCHSVFLCVFLPHKERSSIHSYNKCALNRHVWLVMLLLLCSLGRDGRLESGCVISSKLIWSEGARDSPGLLMSDSQKISMKDVLHLLSADTNPIYRCYEVTLCLHMACTASPRSTLT